MITNIEGIKDPTLAALIALNTPILHFYPCGSRFFGYATESSDFDFFALDDDCEREWLEKNGFTKSKREQAYLDLNSRSIWNRGRVTVILVHSVAARRTLQAHIIKSGKRPPKGDTGFWDNLYHKLCPEVFP